MIILLMCNILIKLLCCSQVLDHTLPPLNILTKFPCHLTLIGPCSTHRHHLLLYASSFLGSNKCVKGDKRSCSFFLACLLDWWVFLCDKEAKCIWSLFEHRCILDNSSLLELVKSLALFCCHFMGKYKVVEKLILFSCDDFGYPWVRILLLNV